MRPTMRTSVVNLPVASGQLLNTGGCLVIHATRETAGAAAVYRLWDSADASGQLLLSISLSANESTRDFFPMHYLPFNTGLYFELVSGAVEGNISAMCDHRCHDALVAELEHALSGEMI